MLSFLIFNVSSMIEIYFIKPDFSVKIKCGNYRNIYVLQLDFENVGTYTDPEKFIIGLNLWELSQNLKVISKYLRISILNKNKVFLK
ncbi:hypothetical protein AR546_15520 [Leptospira interrogans serovar Canicola]|nr:hypothetical protein B2G47_16290 [Leptospira interrogans serovar Canicola]KYZ61333.1 hypothetical protein AWU66_05125 [Leptospira interrogans serovar Pomona]OQM30161.1 hypothetical protein DV38_10875 [Leptospira interrogans]OQM30692.1 hypothetical protein DV30_10410 [Leptospira interrogans serovar Canicola str. Gui44]OQN93705.1 hypothetical protein AR690_07245 [Leptospira interrogans serovar Lai]